MTPKEYTFRYRVRNWPDYNRALITRGRLTFWFDEEVVVAWRNTNPQSGRGAPKVYSDTAIPHGAKTPPTGISWCSDPSLPY